LPLAARAEAMEEHHRRPPPANPGGDLSRAQLESLALEAPLPEPALDESALETR
jgi:hypothetical protein